MPEWARASEVLSADEWEQLEQLPPSEFGAAARDVAGERKAARRRDSSPGLESRAGRRLRKPERILRKQAAGEFPATPRGTLSRWTGLLRGVHEHLAVARREKRDGQSWRDYSETHQEALTRAHELVETLLELCPTTAELLELRDSGHPDAYR